MCLIDADRLENRDGSDQTAPFGIGVGRGGPGGGGGRPPPII